MREDSEVSESEDDMMVVELGWNTERWIFGIVEMKVVVSRRILGLGW